MDELPGVVHLPVSGLFGISGCTGTGCRNINSPQCSNTAATACTYTLGGKRHRRLHRCVRHRYERLRLAHRQRPVGRLERSWRHASTSPAPMSQRLHYIDGPHLCGLPDATNTGYMNAPRLSRNPTCLLDLADLPDYSVEQPYLQFLPVPHDNSGEPDERNVLRRRLRTQRPSERARAGWSGMTNITFDYTTFQPANAYPGRQVRLATR